ncbi:MAG: NAD(+) diphosphatase [Lachnospiraceae bacterium]|nr:NAD(+) diphosphatase [Lachnospiraceae bacterium]
MIQDISPSKLDNHFINHTMNNGDILLQFDSDGRILVHEKEKLCFPCGHLPADWQTIYAFSIDDTKYFLYTGISDNRQEGYRYLSLRDIRSRFTGKEVFAAFTVYHLWKWYMDNKYCGKCRGELDYDSKERALKCPDCGNTIYPRINPAVIVGVTHEDCLLLTKYRKGFAHNALVAGFAEIGETLEETVEREVMEETGLRVKNIQYYKSQPWGIAQDILVGYFCEADGDFTIHMDEGELKYAEWVKREDIVLQPDNLSLTNEMMKVFKENTR